MSKLPPGSRGLPLLGQTLAFVKDPQGFLDAGHAEHGDVFLTNLFFADTVSLSGEKGLEVFNDARWFTRIDSSPGHIQTLLDRDATPFIDPPTHTTRRVLLLQAFTDEALAAYIPTIWAIMTRYAEGWEQRKDLTWVPELSRMCFAIADSLFTGADPTVEDARTYALYQQFLGGIVTLPLALPFTPYGKALRARDGLLAHVSEAYERRKKDPGDDLLSRSIAARGEGGEQLEKREIVMEMVHFYTAYALVEAGLTYLVKAIAEHDDVRVKVFEELDTLPRDRAPTLAELRGLRYVQAVTKESRRAVPLAPLTFFARAKEDVPFGEYTIPKGTKAVGCLSRTLMDERAYPSPRVFDPKRFLDDAELAKRHAFCPHGAGSKKGHRCLGEELAEVMLALFLARLTPYRWALAPGQDLSARKGWIFPTPMDGLKVAFTRI